MVFAMNINFWSITFFKTSDSTQNLLKCRFWVQEMFMIPKNLKAMRLYLLTLKMNLTCAMWALDIDQSDFLSNLIWICQCSIMMCSHWNNTESSDLKTTSHIHIWLRINISLILFGRIPWWLPTKKILRWHISIYTRILILLLSEMLE